ncbi:MAG TPA: ABC transporter substrate-binding protein [Puia sp.]|jgi:iron complex transport system substrate-binding protein|nr:ABC transporter substrate-binding protein [Puia sp.]
MNKLIYFIALSFLFSCHSPTAKNEPTVAAGSEDTARAQTTIRYAHGFTIDYHDGFKLVHILDRNSNKFDTLEYLLVQRGHAIPSGYPRAQVIPIPVQTMIALSSTHVGIADFVGVADRITGLGDFHYVNAPLVRENIRAGRTKEVGLDQNINNELVISMHPGLLMAMSNPEANGARYKVLTDAGIPVIVVAEWLENTPLGKAEWVKLMAALTNREALVNKKFDSVVKTYDSLVQLGRQAKTHPHVIIGMPFKGSWFMPAGDSYMAHFIEAAGGGYNWANTKNTGSLPLNFESVAPEALTAEYWLNIGYVNSKQDILAKDPRFASFRSFKMGNLYNFDKRTNDQGSNDYWESGAVNPHIVLEDMISILHPELLPGHTLVYYRQLQ